MISMQQHGLYLQQLFEEVEFYEQCMPFLVVLIQKYFLIDGAQNRKKDVKNTLFADNLTDLNVSQISVAITFLAYSTKICARVYVVYVLCIQHPNDSSLF